MNPLLKSKGNKPRTGKVKKCSTCKKEFYVKPFGSITAKYCSYQCKAKAQVTGKPLVCKECGKSYYRSPSQVKWRGSSYCSYPCAFKGGKKTKRGKMKPGNENKIWHIDRADRVFSRYIRQRDNWVCRGCQRSFKDRTSILHNSHYWVRGRHSTRFDPDNCIALCYSCHYYKYEQEKQGDYRKLMIDWLGQEKYDELRKRAYTTTNKNDAIKKFMDWIGPQLKGLDIL